MADVDSVTTPPPNATFVVSEAEVGARLDAFLAQRCTDYSRVQLRRAISEGKALVDGKKAKPAYRLVADQTVSIVFPTRGPTGPAPEPIDLQVLYEDEAIAVIDKPVGMVVHPAKGHWSGTLAAAVAHHFSNLSTLGGSTRPGIVHRLDRDTSGVILIAKTDQAHARLAEQFEARSVEKEYRALVSPVPDRDRDWIDAPIGTHSYQREKMAIRPHDPEARSAQTFYEVLERFEGMAYLRVLPKTGRTHQIRVHLAHVGYPILADRLYSGRSRITLGDLSGDRDSEEVILGRQALHAHRLNIEHPVSGERIEFVSPLADDFQACLDAIRQFRGRP